MEEEEEDRYIEHAVLIMLFLLLYNLLLFHYTLITAM